MKVLGIVCSPRINGNTEILVTEALSSAKDSGAELELITLYNKHISFCDSCLSCMDTGRCKIEDDMQGIYSRVLEADGIIFGTPVYFWNVSAQAKVLIDRTYVFRKGRRLRNKVAGVVVVADRAGATQAFNAFLSFFTIHRMISVGGAIAYAGKKGEVTHDERGVAEAKAMGMAVARTLQKYKGNKL